MGVHVPSELLDCIEDQRVGDVPLDEDVTWLAICEPLAGEVHPLGEVRVWI